MSWNLSPPLSVKSSVTIGWLVRGSKSCRVPWRLRSAPVSSGTCRGVVLEQVEEPLRCDAASPLVGAEVAGCAGDHDGLRRRSQQPVTLGELAVELPERRLLGVDRADRRASSCRRRRTTPRRLVVDERLLTRQHLVDRPRRARLAGLRVDRRRDEAALQVELLELRRLADDRRGSGGILDAGKLDRDLVVTLRPDLGLGDTELVDAVTHDRHRPVEILLGQRAPLGRHRLQRDLEPTLQVETERRLVVQR